MREWIWGTVRSGRGEARDFTGLKWVSDPVGRLLGTTPEAGTLNLAVSAEDRRRLSGKHPPRVLKAPKARWCDADLYAVRLEHPFSALAAPGIWIVPHVPDYSSDVMEIIAGVHFRRDWGVLDGTRVRIAIISFVDDDFSTQ